MLFSCAQFANAQIAKIPFEFEDNHIYIKVKTNDSDSLRYVFDTGATGASIDSATAERIGISKENRQIVNVAGSGGAQNYTMATGQTFNLHGLEIKDVNPVLINFNGLKSATGIRLDGILGYELLDKYVAQIDFDQRKLVVYGKINEVDTTGYTSIPFEFSRGIMIPRFPISIQLNTGEVYTGKVMFDSGAAFSLLISTPFNKFHRISEKLTDKIIAQGRGLSAANLEERSTIKNMSFNGFNFGEMVIGLTVNEQAQPNDGYLGILGMDIIKRFNVIVDYQNKKIYLKPNKVYNDPFNQTLESVDGNQKRSSIVSNAAASRAFLTRNKSVKGVNVTSSGLQYKIIKKGTGVKPISKDGVKLAYTLKYLDGKMIAEFTKDAPWRHHIDKALPGMQEAIPMMPVGSKWVLYIPANLAFGEYGDQEVPPGNAFICEIELIEIVK